VGGDAIYRIEVAKPKKGISFGGFLAIKDVQA
jgi:hypothetical protein